MFSASLKTFSEAEELYKENEIFDPNAIANIKSAIGAIYAEKNVFEEAEKYLLEAIDICLLHYGDSAASLPIFYNNLGFLFHRQKKYESAIETFQKALNLVRKTSPFNFFEEAKYIYNIASVNFSKINYLNAKILFEAAKKTWTNHYEDNHQYMILLDEKLKESIEMLGLKTGKNGA